MSKRKPEKVVEKNAPKTKRQKVFALFNQLAGDKLMKALELSEKLMAEGKSEERAWADSLEVLKCVKNEPSEELN